MANLTDYTTYADAQRRFSTARLWELFDGNRERLNIGHECIDRHAVPGRVALRVAHADGRDETIDFAELAAWSSRFAHWLTAEGVMQGDCVAVMLDPSLAFYAAMLADFQNVMHEFTVGTVRDVDFLTWALRLGQHLNYLLDAIGSAK